MRGSTLAHSLEAKLEIELPTTHFRHVPRLVRKRYPQLNDLEQIHVTSHRLEMIIGTCSECTDRSCDDAREFGVL